VRKSVKILIGIVGALLLLFVLVGIFGPNDSHHPKHQAAVSTQRPTPTPATKTSGSKRPKPSAKPSSTARKQHDHHAGVVLTSCHARDFGKLPDPACTPGATYARVTQANIASTICAAGWTDTIRRDEGHTENLKIKQIRLYGYARTNPFDFEEDHLIPLELGGAPFSTRNLWPERGPIPNPKDSVETVLHDAVCNGSVSLRAAQHAIANNWETAESVLGVSGSGGSSGESSRAPAPAPAPVVTHHRHNSSAPAPAPAPTHHHTTSAAPTGCYPKSSSGNCYEAGEFCSDADHGMTGVAGNGDPIKCEGSGSDTWHWEPA
jgi:hypothetical protein